jgi:hypothetical protein
MLRRWLAFWDSNPAPVLNPLVTHLTLVPATARAVTLPPSRMQSSSIEGRQELRATNIQPPAAQAPHGDPGFSACCTSLCTVAVPSAQSAQQLWTRALKQSALKD